MSKSQKRKHAAAAPISERGASHPPVQMSKKKRKIANGDSEIGGATQTSKNSHETASANGVRGDALRWREVVLPDRMDDAEGFYGLEEIDDVDVVKTEQNHVMFVPKYATSIDRDAQINDNGAATRDGEWGGFDDDNATDIEPVKAFTDQAQQPSSQSVPIPQPRKKQKAQKVQTSPKSGTLPEVPDSDIAGFNVLGEVNDADYVDTTAWEDLNLSPQILSAISNLGFSTPTSIQSLAIPPISQGEDVIGKAVTGSGKTLAFGIPILEKWFKFMDVPNNEPRVPIALILAPTRELAYQLVKHLTELGHGLDASPRIVGVTGGLSILKQQRQLETADIVIATPGRLWEVMNDSHGLIDRLKRIKFLVVDEADRLLSEGHFKEVEEILNALDRQVVDEDNEAGGSPKSERQTLVFSATLHKGLQQKLTGKLKPGTNSNLLSNQQAMAYLLQKLSFRSDKPTFIDSNPTSQMALNLHESIVECAAMEKDLYLYAVLLQNIKMKTIVFTNSISAVKRLNQVLTNLELNCFALHSGMIQKARLRSLERFHAQRPSILVATDVAARGLDIKGIELIVHYHVPRAADMYVHRSGRTARAESQGRSILLCSPDEVAGVTRLIMKVHEKDKPPETAPVERQLIKRLAPRTHLSQKIADATIAKEKLASKDDWIKNAAEELGVDYNSEEFEAAGQRGKRGRGGGKALKQKEQGMVSKEQVAAWRAELKGLLSKRVNLGISERYLAGGRVDVDALLDGRTDGMFLEGR